MIKFSSNSRFTELVDKAAVEDEANSCAVVIPGDDVGKSCNVELPGDRAELACDVWSSTLGLPKLALSDEMSDSKLSPQKLREAQNSHCYSKNNSV